MINETHALNRHYSKLNPLTYGLIALTIAFGSLLFGVTYVLIEVVFLLALAWYSGVLKGYVKKWLMTAVLITVIVSILQMLLLPGDEVVFNFLIFDITTYGIERAIIIGSRILGIFSPLIYMLEMIELDDFIMSMEQKGVNPTATYIISSAVNMVPQMKKRLDTITDAQKSRGIETEGNLMTRMKAFIPIIGPVILSSIVGVEEKTITLEVRGFSYKTAKTRLNEVPDTQKDKNIRKIHYGVIILMIIGRVLMWLL